MSISRSVRVRVALGAAMITLSACEKLPAPTPAKALPTVKVRTVATAARGHQATEEIVGTVRAKRRATVEAKVSGRIAKMPVTLGQRVEKGALLVRLDLAETRAKLHQAQAMLEQANGDLKRYSALLAKQAVTRQEFDAAQAKQRVAEASVAEVRTMLGYATIQAPFAGVVTRKLANVGDQATPGRPLLELEDPHDLRFELGVPEALIERVERGDKLPVRLTNQSETVEGTVVEISPSADPNSRTFLTKLDLAQREGVRIGQFGRALIPTAKTTILRVPRSAVVVRGQMELVFVVVKDRAHLRLVKTGKRIGGQVELVSGVDAGEQVVVEGAKRLSDRQPVEVVR